MLCLFADYVATVCSAWSTVSNKNRHLILHQHFTAEALRLPWCTYAYWNSAHKNKVHNRFFFTSTQEECTHTERTMKWCIPLKVAAWLNVESFLNCQKTRILLPSSDSPVLLYSALILAYLGLDWWRSLLCIPSPMSCVNLSWICSPAACYYHMADFIFD